MSSVYKPVVPYSSKKKGSSDTVLIVAFTVVLLASVATSIGLAIYNTYGSNAQSTLGKIFIKSKFHIPRLHKAMTLHKIQSGDMLVQQISPDVPKSDHPLYPILFNAHDNLGAKYDSYPRETLLNLQVTYIIRMVLLRKSSHGKNVFSKSAYFSSPVLMGSPIVPYQLKEPEDAVKINFNNGRGNRDYFGVTPTDSLHPLITEKLAFLRELNNNEVRFGSAAIIKNVDIFSEVGIGLDYGVQFNIIDKTLVKSQTVDTQNTGRTYSVGSYIGYKKVPGESFDTINPIAGTPEHSKETYIGLMDNYNENRGKTLVSNGSSGAVVYNSDTGGYTSNGSAATLNHNGSNTITGGYIDGFEFKQENSILLVPDEGLMSAVLCDYLSVISTNLVGTSGSQILVGTETQRETGNSLLNHEGGIIAADLLEDPAYLNEIYDSQGTVAEASTKETHDGKLIF